MVYENYFNPEYMGYIKEGNFVREKFAQKWKSTIIY